ncbi:MAG: response regulator [Dysgonamonadaceae bacterium]|jgi:signal transduction histidine kinase/ligand-binding sensor domain-containing protein/DNA-binding response OmpR family regulator|nr:response regulator [Dysgonamonadaceae bacterium]
MKFLKTIWLLFFSTVAINLMAQTTKFYSMEQGLSNSLINRVYQDRKGFLWIATESGLNRFDGNKFFVYRRDANNPNSLKNNYVRTIYESAGGEFLIGCIDGLLRYDRNTGEFREIEIYDGFNRPLHPHITSIMERPDGEIWLTTSGSGLFSMKKGEKICRFDRTLNEKLCSRFLTTIFEDSSGRLWIGSENSGLNILTPSTGEVLTYSETAPEGRRIAGNAVSAICERERGEIFVGMLNGGLCRFDSESRRFTSIPDYNGSLALPVKSLLVDRRRQLFVGSDGSGMRKYNPERRIMEAYEPFSVSFNFSKAKIHSLLEDSNGNIWAGIFQRGALFIPENPNRFKYYGYKSFRENSIGSNCVMAIYRDSEGLVWIGTDNDGLYSINEKTGQVRHFDNSSDPLVPATITCLYEDASGQLWLGSYLNGIGLFDRRSGRSTAIPENLRKIFSDSKVYCMTGDGRGSLWIGTYGAGLYRLDLKTMKIAAHYYQNREGDEGLSNNWINAMQTDGEGMLWIATYNGLCCLNPATESFKTWNQSNSDIPSNIVSSLKCDRLGNIWFGTDEGLLHLDPKSGKIQVFTTADGLPSNSICSIETDRDNNVWVSTLTCLSKYSPTNNQFVNFYTSDGLQENEFSRSAHFVSRDGELFFGGINGVTSFFPENIHSGRKQVNVFLTGFYLSGKPVVSGMKSGGREILDRFIMDAERINLAANDNVFSFEFSTMDYGNTDEISYRYMLEGFNSDWVTTEPGNYQISFTNISHGKYRLLYQAEYKDNKSEIKSIEIVIRPPWYLSVPAKIAYFLLFLAAIFLVYRVISFRIKQRNEMLRLEHADQINEAKLQFFINISHEIRTPMTLIMGPLEKLLMDNRYPELRDSYLLIYRNAQRILRLINQLMDIRKIDRGLMRLKLRETDIVGFIRDIMKAFDYMAQKKNISFEFFPETESLKVWIDLNNFDKVLFNVFSNAFKFTPEGGKISVELSTGEDPKAESALRKFFQIRVIDTGIGIEKDKIDRIFERFYQIDNEISNSNFGAGVGLHLSRSLIELQHGIIFAENRGDIQGSCFTIRMPLGSSHLRAEEMEILPEKAPLATFDYSRKDDLFDVEAEAENEVKLAAKTKYSILIAEDDREINNYIRKELGSAYKIIQTYDGREALDAVLNKKPDLVVSDIMMPEMDGITLCRRIKQNVNVDYIPVLLLTAKSNEEDLSEGLETGADAYIVKPFNPSILRKTIANLLDNRERLKGKFQKHSDGKMEKIELKSADEALMEKIMKTINQNISNPDFSVEALSAAVSVSRVHLHRKLKELTNYSPRDFIRYLRLKQAAELLHSKKLTISEVAYAVGFSSLAHFSNSFREFYGLTPKEYMEGRNLA